jgi:hypothetical protein
MLRRTLKTKIKYVSHVSLNIKVVVDDDDDDYGDNDVDDDDVREHRKPEIGSSPGDSSSRRKTHRLETLNFLVTSMFLNKFKDLDKVTGLERGNLEQCKKKRLLIGLFLSALK